MAWHGMAWHAVVQGDMVGAPMLDQVTRVAAFYTKTIGRLHATWKWATHKEIEGDEERVSHMHWKDGSIYCKTAKVAG